MTSDEILADYPTLAAAIAAFATDTGTRVNIRPMCGRADLIVVPPDRPSIIAATVEVSKNHLAIKDGYQLVYLKRTTSRGGTGRAFERAVLSRLSAALSKV